MEACWLIILVTVFLFLSLKPILTLLFPSLNKSHRLPPGPLPIVGTLLFLRVSFNKLEPLLLRLHAKYGPIITFPIGFFPAIFIADRSLAYQALVQNGAVFSDRPDALATSKIINSHQHNISSSGYGPTWRALRRNLTSEILHPARIKSFYGTRRWVADMLVHKLRAHCQSSNRIKLMDHILHAIFSLLAFMCFGEKLSDKQIDRIEHVQRTILLRYNRFLMLNFWPRISKILLRKRWDEFMQLRKNQADVMVPLIRARKQVKQESLNKAKEDKGEVIVSYVDTLLDLEWPDEKRRLDEDEIVNLISEFLNAGTDTTATSLEWVMANLVKYPHIQQRLYEEIKSVMGDSKEKLVNEAYLNKLPYLKAVILEGLRRHPPGRVVIPHSVTKDVVLNDYLVPKNGTVNFMVAKMGWDPKVWEDPMEFKPERFLNSEKNEVEAFDFTGTKEIKMMPFGAGRRMCPGNNLAILHMEYFVANLIWNFEWKSPDGDVDLSEKQEFTMMMKTPLQVSLSPRF
ncbi:cytochrome P450 89A2-like [Prosopis cineraria]|uniref:cytochrome P450 89A2-like n=1 Tax=Prosopis cineraria TaxID=364024 RepID=UPI00240FE717|nr:cytochrome P450 89A2-like [Prosopis cineraria]